MPSFFETFPVKALKVPGYDVVLGDTPHGSRVQVLGLLWSYTLHVGSRLPSSSYRDASPTTDSWIKWATDPKVLGRHPGDTTPVYTRRMPSFFETFPVLVVDATGVVRADQPFRRAEANYAIEGVGLRVTMLGGTLSGVELTTPSK
jgi:hypothetical protein